MFFIITLLFVAIAVNKIGFINLLPSQVFGLCILTLLTPAILYAEYITYMKIFTDFTLKETEWVRFGHMTCMIAELIGACICIIRTVDFFAAADNAARENRK